MIGGLFSSRYCYAEFHTLITSSALTCAHLSSFQGLWLVDSWCLHYIACDVLDQKKTEAWTTWKTTCSMKGKHWKILALFVGEGVQYFANCGFMCGFAANADAVFGHSFVWIAVPVKILSFYLNIWNCFFSKEMLNPLLKPWGIKFSNRTLFCPLICSPPFIFWIPLYTRVNILSKSPPRGWAHVFQLGSHWRQSVVRPVSVTRSNVSGGVAGG